MITSFEVYLAILIGNLSSVASTLSLICAFAFCIEVFICLKCPVEPFLKKLLGVEGDMKSK